MKKTTPLQKLINECVALSIKICLTLKPKCEFCGQPAITAHHFIHQARSNYLKCDQKNLVSVCGGCHGSIHIGNMESSMGLKLRKIRGKAWENYILKGTQQTIKSDFYYWEHMKIKLTIKLNSLTK